MIKSKELRIDNWVRFFKTGIDPTLSTQEIVFADIEVQIDSVYENEIKIKSNIYGLRYEFTGIREIKPILLKKFMLEDLKTKLKALRNMLLIHIKNEIIEIEIIETGKMVKSVHHLQNLYYFLTGQEFEYK